MHPGHFVLYVRRRIATEARRTIAREVHLHCVTVEVLNFYISLVLSSISFTNIDRRIYLDAKKEKKDINIHRFSSDRTLQRLFEKIKDSIIALSHINFKSRLRLMIHRLVKIHSKEEELPVLKLFKVLRCSRSGYILSYIQIRSIRWHGKNIVNI